MDQVSFEAGLLIGLRTAQVVARKEVQMAPVVRILAELGSLVAELKDVQRERKGDLSMRAMVAGDIFFDVPLADPRDFGLNADEYEIALSKVSRMKFLAEEQVT